MDLANMIKSEQKKLDREYTAGLEKEELLLKERCEELKPMIELINEGLKEVGLSGHLQAVLHSNKKHYPCPAIHIKGNGRMSIYDQFGEIYKTDGKDNRWRSGGCNSHSYKHYDDNALVGFIAKTIAEKVLKRKRVG